MVEVSIITPAYNADSYIQETLNSVLRQSFTLWELIIVDDKSQDNTVSIVKQYMAQDSRIQLVCNDENLGPGLSRNKGIACAKGRFLAFIDSDDVWLPSKLEIQLEFMKSKNVAISYTSYELIDSKSNSLNKKIEVASKPLDYRSYLGNTIIGFSTAMIDQSKVHEIVLPALPSREDTFLWISLLRTGKLAYGIHNILTQYRVHNQSISSSKLKASMQVWILYRKYVGLNFFQALFYFSSYALHAVKKRL